MGVYFMAHNKNMEIRNCLKTHNLYVYEGAIACGVSDFTFSKWLHREIPQEKKEKIIEAIEKYASERSKSND